MSPESKKYSRYFTYIEPVLKAPIIKTYGSLILTIGALIIFIVFAIKPTLATISNLQKELDVKKETLAKLEEKSRNLTLAQQNLGQISPEAKDYLQSNIPNKSEVSGLVKSLEGTTIESQATISALQLQPVVIEQSGQTTEDPTLKEIDFIYNVENNYDTVNKILDNLKSSSRLVVVNNFSVNKVPDSPNLLLSVTGKAFFLK